MADTSSDRAASVAASVVGSQDGSRRGRLVIWPEFQEADLNAEKWDAVPDTTHKAKEKDKGKSPNANQTQNLFDDPDGKLKMPSSLRVATWKRPSDWLQDKTPVVVENDNASFDLLSDNEHLDHSELMRWIISQISALWGMAQNNGVFFDHLDFGSGYGWKPWDHVYALCKVGKGGQHQPQYNPNGKYVVRLYWMGTWRKITVDDLFPFDDKDRLLLPQTGNNTELWPMLLAKGIIKVISLDFNGGTSFAYPELGDASVIHALTAWLPEVIPLHRGVLKQVWDLMNGLLPEWKHPDPDADKKEDEKNVDSDPDKDKDELESKKDSAEKDGSKTAKDAKKGERSGRDTRSGGDVADVHRQAGTSTTSIRARPVLD